MSHSQLTLFTLCLLCVSVLSVEWLPRIAPKMCGTDLLRAVTVDCFKDGITDCPLPKQTAQEIFTYDYYVQLTYAREGLYLNNTKSFAERARFGNNISKYCQSEFYLADHCCTNRCTISFLRARCCETVAFLSTLSEEKQLKFRSDILSAPRF